MPTLDLKGMELYYELHGTGTPLVLIAGYTGDHTFWNLMLNVSTQYGSVHRRK